MNESAAGRSQLSLAAIVALAMFLLAPTLAMDFYADDNVHQLVLRGDSSRGPMQPWSLYDFATLEDWRAVEDESGSFPWWTGDGWRVRFLRPVTSLVLYGQHVLFADWAFGYHLFGLLLHALLIVLVHGLYRDLGLGARAAGTGTLLFALCDSAVLPAGWPANLNTLLVALFAVGALRCVLPRGGRCIRPALGLALALLATLSKESGVVVLSLVGGVLALRARAERDSPEKRVFLAWAVAAVVLLALYLATIVVGGFGTQSLFYATPWEEPRAFLSNVVVLLGAGQVSLVGPFPLDVVTPFPQVRVAVTLVGCVLGPLLAVWIGRRVWGATGAAWLLLWLLLFLLVQGGAPPGDRLLFVPAIGAAGLLALFFERSSAAPSSRTVVRLATRALWVSATIGSGLYLFVQGVSMSVSADHLREVSLQTEVGDPSVGHRDLFILQTESQMHAFVLPSTWALESDDRALAFWSCQIGNRPVRWTRVDATTFDLESLGEPFLTNGFERVYLTEEPIVAVGDRWTTSAFEVEAIAVADGLPTHLRFRLQRSLDDPTTLFLAPREGRLAAHAPPIVGASIEFESPERTGPYMP